VGSSRGGRGGEKKKPVTKTEDGQSRNEGWEREKGGIEDIVGQRSNAYQTAFVTKGLGGETY